MLKIVKNKKGEIPSFMIMIAIIGIALIAIISYFITYNNTMNYERIEDVNVDVENDIVVN